MEGKKLGACTLRKLALGHSQFAKKVPISLLEAGSRKLKCSVWNKEKKKGQRREGQQQQHRPVCWSSNFVAHACSPVFARETGECS
jgi:hypothetical protein